MPFYREKFPRTTVLPKMHILDDDTIPWLHRRYLGAGLVGEQETWVHSRTCGQTWGSVSWDSKTLDWLKHIYCVCWTKSGVGTNSEQYKTRTETVQKEKTRKDWQPRPPALCLHSVYIFFLPTCNKLACITVNTLVWQSTPREKILHTTASVHRSPSTKFGIPIRDIMMI